MSEPAPAPSPAASEPPAVPEPAPTPAVTAAAALVWTLPEGVTIGRILLAHGAGAGHDAPFMQRLAAALAAEGIAVARFDFPYMAARANGKRKPPPKAEKLVEGFLATVAAFLVAPEASGPALIAGKSMGGRIAVMAASSAALPAEIAGAVAYGYPFQPQGGGEWRLAPLEAAARPVLICQGERDPFGDRAAVEATTLPTTVTVHWIDDGSHDFGPRGHVEATLAGNIAAAARATAAFLASRAP